MTSLVIAGTTPARDGMMLTQSSVEPLILTHLLLLSCVVFAEEENVSTMTALVIAGMTPARHGMIATQTAVEVLILTHLLLLSCVVLVEEEMVTVLTVEVIVPTHALDVPKGMVQVGAMEIVYGRMENAN